MRVSSLSSPHQWLSALFMVTVGTQVANAYPGKRYHNSTCPPVTGNFTVSHYQLYPENADWDSESCLLYFGSLFNSTVAVYDPYKATIVNVLSIPNISYNPLLHLGGVDFDTRTGLWSIVADGAAPFSTGGKDVSGPNYALLYNPKTKALIYNIDLTAIAGGKYSGFQDIEQDASGNVYIVGTYSSSIIKISADGKKAAPWYLEQPVISNRSGLTGIASTGNILLAADNNNGGKVVRFDLKEETGKAVAVPLTPDTKLGGTDAVIVPTKYNGTVFLIASPGAGIHVVLSRDGKWEKAEYKGLIPRATAGDAAGSFVTAPVQIAQSIYALHEWFDAPPAGALAANRTRFPLTDITARVDELIK